MNVYGLGTHWTHYVHFDNGCLGRRRRINQGIHRRQELDGFTHSGGPYRGVHRRQGPDGFMYGGGKRLGEIYRNGIERQLKKQRGKPWKPPCPAEPLSTDMTLPRRKLPEQPRNFSPTRPATATWYTLPINYQLSAHFTSGNMS